MLHTTFLRSELSPERIRKGLVTRATGRFYTPETIGTRLVSNAILNLSPGRHQNLTVIDPFCGDGRLLAWVLTTLCASGHKGEVSVEGWDIDEAALVSARRKIAAIAAEMPFAVSICMRRRDTFAHDPLRRFDIVVTNPPWDVLKPDRRELTALTPKQQLGYISQLREQAGLLKARFPNAQSAEFAGRSQNLARTGIEASLGLAKRNGVCGIVFPATLLADQASAPLRKWMFEEFHVSNIDFYAAELKLFADVDQASVGVVLSAPQSPQPPLMLGLANRLGDFVTSQLHHSDIAYLGNRIPFNSGIRGIEIQRGLRSLPTFRSLEGEMIWAGRELDETNHTSFLSSTGSIAFVKGRMVGRYELEPSRSFVSRLGPQIPKSTDHWRVAWRDVSRQTQKRRMQATLVPPHSVTGNSLNVAYMKNGDPVGLRWLLGVMNSLVFEYQVRSLSATSHISLGTARQVKVPPITRRLQSKIATLTERRLAGDLSAEIPLEIAVAKSYGLDRNDFETIVASYARLEENLKMDLLTAW